MNYVKKLHKHQVFRFIVVGAGCAGVEFILFAILVNIYHVQYLLANIISLLVAVFLNYFISRKIVFESGKYNSHLEFIAFTFFTGIGVALNQFLLWFFASRLQQDLILSKVLAIGLVAVFNYFTKKYLVFVK